MLAVGLAVGCLLTATGCGGTAQQTSPNAAAVISSLGSVPIPSSASATPTPVADLAHGQLLAIGEPVQVKLPGVEAVVTALGPEELTPYTGGTAPRQTVGIITVSVAVRTGTLTLATSEFDSRDELGRGVGLTPDGPANVQVAAGHTGTLKYQGTFASGAAQVTWRHAGHVLAIWDFNVELD